MTGITELQWECEWGHKILWVQLVEIFHFCLGDNLIPNRCRFGFGIVAVWFFFGRRSWFSYKLALGKPRWFWVAESGHFAKMKWTIWAQVRDTMWMLLGQRVERTQSAHPLRVPCGRSRWHTEAKTSKTHMMSILGILIRLPFLMFLMKNLPIQSYIYIMLAVMERLQL